MNQRDGAGMTPLIWAARYGHEQVVRLLLGNEHIQLDQQDVSSGRTALSWAAGNGHEGVVRLFLGPRYVDSRRTGRRWGKAARAVGVLIGVRYANPDIPDTANGRTPLSWAAGNGHEGIVALLLGRKDVNPHSSSKSLRTPLSWAAANGHEGIVKLLLVRGDGNSDTPNAYHCNIALSLAAENGHEAIMRLLGRLSTP